MSDLRAISRSASAIDPVECFAVAMLKKILAPTDFSELSGEGVRYACLLANDVGAQVIVLNVVVLDETNTVADGETKRTKNSSPHLSAWLFPITVPT